MKERKYNLDDVNEYRNNYNAVLNAMDWELLE